MQNKRLGARAACVIVESVHHLLHSIFVLIEGVYCQNRVEGIISIGGDGRNTLGDGVLGDGVWVIYDQTTCTAACDKKLSVIRPCLKSADRNQSARGYLRKHWRKRSAVGRGCPGGGTDCGQGGLDGRHSAAVLACYLAAHVIVVQEDILLSDLRPGEGDPSLIRGPGARRFGQVIAVAD